MIVLEVLVYLICPAIAGWSIGRYLARRFVR